MHGVTYLSFMAKQIKAVAKIWIEQHNPNIIKYIYRCVYLSIFFQPIINIIYKKWNKVPFVFFCTSFSNRLDDDKTYPISYSGNHHFVEFHQLSYDSDASFGSSNVCTCHPILIQTEVSLPYQNMLKVLLHI